MAREWHELPTWWDRMTAPREHEPVFTNDGAEFDGWHGQLEPAPTLIDWQPGRARRTGTALRRPARWLLWGLVIGGLIAAGVDVATTPAAPTSSISVGN